MHVGPGRTPLRDDHWPLLDPRRYGENVHARPSDEHEVFPRGLLQSSARSARTGGHIRSPGIGHGVWIGHNAIILATTKSIGNGAVIGPGAVVYRDVPAYAIVQGNPAQVVGFRYPKNVIDELLESRWWEKTATEVGMPAEQAAAEPSCFVKRQHV